MPARVLKGHLKKADVDEDGQSSLRFVFPISERSEALQVATLTQQVLYVVVMTPQDFNTIKAHLQGAE